jgi:hypothetical protein
LTEHKLEARREQSQSALTKVVILFYFFPANLFRGPSRVSGVGNAGRNILRSDGLNQVDFGIIKNTRLSENVRLQLRADMFNAFNFRNFGVPIGALNSGANFLNQWATNGNRRIVLGARLTF